MQLVLVVANYNCMLHKIVNIIIVYIGILNLSVLMAAIITHNI